MGFFDSEDAAARYDAFRPRVHDLALEWLTACLGEIRFSRAIDIACGTGHSTLPLKRVAASVLGIDVSGAMLAHARARGLDVRLGSCEELTETGAFDLLSTCMAFHWFDPGRAIESYKRISTDGAIWLIYNFDFAGHSRSREFNRWLAGEYLREFPVPPRHRTRGVLPREDPEITLLVEESGTIPIEFDAEQLVGYLTTQTNVEEAVKQGATYREVGRRLLSAVRALDREGPYRYNFSYEICRYR